MQYKQFLPEAEQREFFLQCREDKFAGLELALPLTKDIHCDAFTLFTTEEGVGIANELLNLNRVKTFNYMFPPMSSHHIFKETEYLMFFIEHSSITNWTVNSIPESEYKDLASPLHVAAYHDYYEAIELLVEQGANVNITDKNGNTPLHFAAEECNVNAIECLLTYGADVSKVNNKGQTALLMAKNTDAYCWVENNEVINLPRHKETISLLKSHKKALAIWDLWELTPNYVSYLQQLPLERMEFVIYLTTVIK